MFSHVGINITMTSITVHHTLLGFETSHEVLDLPSRYYDDNDDIDDDDQQWQKIPASHEISIMPR